MNVLIRQVLEGASPEQVVADLFEFRLTDMGNLSRAVVRRAGEGYRLLNISQSGFRFTSPDGVTFDVNNIGNEFLQVQSSLSNKRIRFAYPVIPPTLDKLVKVVSQPKLNF